ncbi:hypothetical protein NP493_1467g00004 [Ridgeia piscesae]|uniref:DUF4874 domain-containing protein n=1 Tax=Ridgeia piscesae TaxID=27915 RepID=A0AAD9K3H5_RIDPI|nr:hypothetical protein NP493_1467g00004 [Ridgeia piscesae]
MTRLPKTLLLLFAVCNLSLRSTNAVCSTCDNLISVPAGYTEVTYTETPEELQNPNRGFLKLNSAKSSSYRPLKVSSLERYRSEDGITMHWRQFVLDEFVSSDITKEFLDNIRSDLETIRNARFTTVTRILYVKEMPENGEAPYGDATKEWMLRHIEQLSPIFSEYEDVIDVVQAGFIGVWGEWYYTTHFGDPHHRDYDNPDNIDGYTPQQWQDRKEVLFALIDSVPSSMLVTLHF